MFYVTLIDYKLKTYIYIITNTIELITGIGVAKL